MKIIWFNHRSLSHPLSGGNGRTIRELSRRLRLMGHEIRLVMGGGTRLKEATTLEGVQITVLKGYSLPHLVVPVELADRSIDVVVEDLAHVVPWGSRWFTSAPGTAFFHHLHARTLRGQVSPLSAAVLQTIESRYKNFYVDWPFVTESLQSAEDLTALGISPERITRIPPGVDTKLFRIGRKSPEPEAVYFGGLRPYKRPGDALASAVPLLRSGRLSKLHIVGEGDERSRLQQLVSEANLNQQVIFHGNMTDSALAELVASTWVSIHAAIAEGWCFSAMEAAASGVPVVAYAVPGLLESVQHGRTGLLVEDGSVAQLSNGIAEVIAGPERWQAACRSWALTHDWSASAAQWEAHLSRLAGSMVRG